MSEQIIQTLGFDAEGAISTINTLNQSLATLATQLNSVAGGARAFNQAKISRSFKALNAADPSKTLGGAATAASSLGAKLDSAGNKGGQALNTLNNQTKNLTLSWQTLGRIVATQVIVRAFSKITGGIGDAIDQTRELQKRVGEIQTIAGGSLGSNADVFANLTATSEKFGFDVLDVAEAKYQELSNQVDKSTETIEFQEAAAKLARATNSSLTDSVNLLSSSLNAFGKDATQSNEVAGILFKTIEQGRIRAGELANSLGRVAPLANALGISFNDLGSAVSRITQGGAKADTALTQVLGILNKLSKPTESLSAAFQELGVSTAQEGIQQSGGLLQFLQRIQQVAGDDAALVGFFNNVRAIQGVLSLLGTDADKTGEVFDALNISTQEAGEALENAFQTAVNNDAVTYEQSVQELSSTFRDFATVVIPIINDALEGLNSFLDDVQANPIFSGSVLAAGAASLLAFGSASTVASVGIGGMATAASGLLVSLGPLVLAVGATVAAFILLSDAVEQFEKAQYAPLVERATEVLDRFNKNLDDSHSRLLDQSEGFKEAARAAAVFGAQFTDLRKEAASSVAELNREFTSSSTSALNSILKTRQSISRQIQDAVTKADSLQVKSAEKVASIQAKKDDFLLNRRLKNLNDLQRASGLFNASQEQAFNAKDLIQGTGDLKDFDSAAKVLERRLDLAQKGLAAANASGNAGVIAKAEQQVVTALNDQVNLERQRSEIIEKRRQAAKAAAAEDAAQTEKLKSLVGSVKKELSVLNNNGQIFNETQLQAQEKRVNDLLLQLSQFGLDSGQVDLTEFLGIQSLATQFDNDLDNAVQGIRGRRGEVVGEVEGIFTSLNKVVDDNVLQIGIELDLVQDGPDQISSLISALAEGTREIDNLTGAQERFEAAQQSVVSTGEIFKSLFKDTTGPGQFAEQINSAVDAIATNPNLSPEKFEEFMSALRAVIGTDVFNRFDLGGEAGDTAVLQEALNIFEKLTAARQTAAEIGGATESDRLRLESLLAFKTAAESNIETVNRLNTSLNGSTETVGQMGEAALANIGSINSNASAWDVTASAASRAKVAVDAYSRSVQSANTIAPPPLPTPTNRMFGGPLYRAAGGAARGTDTIPAMLSPGEFVVNSRSSKQFASQLIAMNAGVNPVYRAEGGTVSDNSVNIGDINVNGTSNPDDTARLVLSKLRREFRRGTSSRF
jgi:TP901 family phage tail tape measure protein